MEIKVKLGSDDMARLAKLVTTGDLDLADHNALRGILWALANKAGLCSFDGEPTMSAYLTANCLTV